MKLRSVVVLSLQLLGLTSASAASLGTAFTYQGRLNDGPNPANGRYDLQFISYDAASGGTPVGSVLTTNAVPVSDGLFAVTLDFGAGAITGDARWLEIAVRTNGGGAFTALSPRQELRPSAYALFASAAGSVPWSGLTGVPAGLADGVDDDTTYSAGPGLNLDGTTFTVAPGGVDNSRLADGAVATAKIADSAVTGAKLASDAVDTTKIQAGAVTAPKLAPSSIGPLHLIDASVTAGKLAGDTVASSNIVQGAVGTAQIADAAITRAKLAAGSIDAVLIANSAIGTLQLANRAVTQAKLAADAAGAVDVKDYGARADSGESRITQTDIETHPGWLGSYAVGDTWDYVGIQEAIYAA